MEHKLILGGEHLLPFARSRIRALKATGLKYASQQFEIDGCSIKVRIEGEHEFIRLEGGGFTLLMDSGLVDYLNDDGTLGLQYLPGKLYETSSVADYNEAFTVKNGEGWRTRPGKGSKGQFSGKLTFAGNHKFSGRVRDDGGDAASFSPALEESSPPTVPATWEYIADDEALKEKKLMVGRCPASMFTGKCRLYVQAMYGRARFDNPRAATPKENLGPYLAEDLFPRGLRIPAYESIKRPGSHDAVPLTTGSGVYLDKATGKHWLINTSYSSATFFPLKANASGESWRKFLITAGPLANDQERLNGEDLEHLEAYILASCLPVVEKKQVVTFPEITGWAMGYLWHWNWSGTAADIVVTIRTKHLQTDSYMWDPWAMRSTHYRLAPTLTVSAATADTPEENIWSVTLEAVDGPSDWAVQRVFHCLAEPGWLSGGTDKSTPKESDLFDCDAPFYVFYQRDELQVCRAKVKKVLGSDVIDRSPHWLDISDYTTLGLEPGGFYIRKKVRDHYLVSFSCGEYSTPTLHHAYEAFGYANTVEGVTLDRVTKTPVYYSYDDRYALSGNPPHETVYLGYGGLANSQYFVRSVQTDSSYYESRSSHAEILVPFYDAEAIIIAERGQTDVLRRDVVKSTIESRGHMSGLCLFDGDTNVFGEDAVRFEYRRNATDPSMNLITPRAGHPDESTTEVTSESQKLISKAGVTHFLVGDQPGLHDDRVESIGMGFGVKSGTRVTLPTVVSSPHYLMNPVGVPSPEAAEANYQTLVGWV